MPAKNALLGDNRSSPKVLKRLEVIRTALENLPSGGRLTKELGLKALENTGLIPGKTGGFNGIWKVIYTKLEGKQLSSGKEIRRDGSELFCLEAQKKPLREERADLRNAEKNAIAEFLWLWLYDLTSIWPEDPSRSADNFNNFQAAATANWQIDDNIHVELERKRANFRARMVTEIVIDSGTTTAICANAFLRSENMPLKTTSPLGVHLTRPSIITNCIEIASAFSRCRHRREIQLRVIGGMEHHERRSICGDLTLQWIKYCRGNGMLMQSDLSIIGTTGYLNNSHRSLPAFGCDDPLESAVKSELLQSSRFRILVMDSTKISFASVVGCFATLSPHDVDLIVTDDGTLGDRSGDPGVAKNIREFLQQAYAFKVPVICVTGTKI